MTEDETIAPADGNNEEKKDGITPQAAPMQPAAFASPESVVPPALQTEKNDFTKILEEIKLPERRDFKAIADVPKAQPPEAAILEEHIVKAAAPASSAPEEESGEGKIDASSIVAPERTLKDDLQTIVREKKISLVRAVSLEEDKKRGQEHLAPEQQEIRARRSRRTFGIIFASAILLLLGAGALFGIFYVIQKQESQPLPPQTSILFAEQTVTFSLDGQSAQTLKSALAQARSGQLGQLGSITRIVPTVTATSTSGQATAAPASISQFFSALGMNPPQELMGAIGPDFFFGFHVVDTNAPLFVIPVTSYDRAFAGMLAWEPTMDSDLSPIFTSVPMTQADSAGVPQARTFEDDVLLNYDVRELKDDSGNVVLYYSFPTPNILVIAESTYSFGEILSRLQADREL